MTEPPNEPPTPLKPLGLDPWNIKGIVAEPVCWARDCTGRNNIAPCSICEMVYFCDAKHSDASRVVHLEESCIKTSTACARYVSEMRLYLDIKDVYSASAAAAGPASALSQAAIEYFSTCCNLKIPTAYKKMLYNAIDWIREQQAYSLIRWWSYRPGVPNLFRAKADALEDPVSFYRNLGSQSIIYLDGLLRIKLKLYCDLPMVAATQILSYRLPLDIINRIRDFGIISELSRKCRRVYETPFQVWRELGDQIRALLDEMDQINPSYIYFRFSEHYEANPEIQWARIGLADARHSELAMKLTRGSSLGWENDKQCYTALRQFLQSYHLEHPLWMHLIDRN